MIDMVTLGESMVVFDPASYGPLRHVHDFKKHLAGAESNVSIGMARLGHKVGFLSRIGDDEFGHYIVSTLRSEGVDVSQTKVDTNAQTGVMFKEKRNNKNLSVYYYRKHSAASFLNEDDVDEAWIRSARLLHITGITPALSESCLGAVKKAIRIAKEENVPVSFDANLRLKLWGIDQAKKTIYELMRHSTFFLPGFSEGRILSGIDSVDEMAKHFYQLGPQVVVIKDGEKGAYLYDRNGGRWVPGFQVDEVVDPIGAGDAFAAGFLSGILKGLTHDEAVRKGNLLGACAVSVRGDWEGLPCEKELKHVLAFEDTVR